MRETATKWLDYIEHGMPECLVVRVKQPGVVPVFVSSASTDEFHVWKDAGYPWTEDVDLVWERLDETLHEHDDGRVDVVPVEEAPSREDEPTIEA